MVRTVHALSPLSLLIVYIATADRTLFLGILKTHKITVDNEAMSEYMIKAGYQFTASAIQNRMTRLKKMTKNEYALTYVLPVALLMKVIARMVRKSLRDQGVGVVPRQLPTARHRPKNRRPRRRLRRLRRLTETMTRRSRRTRAMVTWYSG